MNFFSGLLTTLFERTSELLPGQFGSGNDLNTLSKELLSARGGIRHRDCRTYPQPLPAG